MSAARVAACAVAWVLGLVPLLLPTALLGGTSRFALLASIQAAVLGLPFAAQSGRPPSVRAPVGAPVDAPARASRTRASIATLGALALCAPSLVLALGLDARVGLVAATGAGPVARALALVAALAFAAELAARATRVGAGVYAWIFGVLVVGAPLLSGALVMGGGGRGPAWLARVARASPLAWLAAPSQELEWGPFVVVSVAIFAGLACARSEP